MGFSFPDFGGGSQNSNPKCSRRKQNKCKVTKNWQKKLKQLEAKNDEIVKEKIEWEEKYVQLEKVQKEVESRKSEALQEKAQSEQKHEELVHMYEEQVKQNGDIQKDKLEQLQNNAALMTKNKELQTKNLQLEHKEQIQEGNNLKGNLQASVEEFDKLQQKCNKTQDENVTLA